MMRKIVNPIFSRERSALTRNGAGKPSAAYSDVCNLSKKYF